MTAEVFLDTAYAVALSAKSDALHRRAVSLANQMQAEGTHLVTTQAVLLEIGNSLSKRRYRVAAVRLLRALLSDPNVEIVPLSEELCARALELFRERPDKEWGLTDCISFVVMQDRRIVEALTADEHFVEAGFVALMREDHL